LLPDGYASLRLIVYITFVSAVIAKAEMENLQNFIAFLDQDIEKFRKCLNLWAKMLEMRQDKKRRHKKQLVEVSGECQQEVAA
jgi:flagellar biosynthesis chaperone FliJ